MKSKIVKLAIIPAFIIFVVAYLTVGSQSSMTSVIVAKNNINAGTVVTKDMIGKIKLPSANVPADAIKNEKDVIGKKLGVSRVAGDLILKSAFAGKQIRINDEQVLFFLPVPSVMKDYISEKSVLAVKAVATNSNESEPFISDLDVIAVISNKDNGSSKDNFYAVLMIDKGKAETLAHYVKNNNYVVMVQK